jgi:DNA-binding HxlR family transcriptional regulator
LARGGRGVGGGRGAVRFDPGRATENYRLIYEVLEELGEAPAMDILERVVKRKGRPVSYSELTKKLRRLEEAGVVEKVVLVGASSPRILWRLKKEEGEEAG